MKIKDFTKLYLVLLAAHLAAVYVGEHQYLIYFTKPTLLFSLGVYAWSKMMEANAKGFSQVVLALFFSGVGDVLLMFYSGEERGLFWGGMGSFLVSHLFYMRYYILECKSIFKAKWLDFALLFTLLAGAAFLVMQFQEIHSIMHLGIAVYATALICHVFFAFKRRHFVAPLSFFYTFGGAVLFLISDALLGYNQFVNALPYGGVWVMATYGLGQYGIVRGILCRI
ncbi:MAG: lysoplasmalogenase [Schleiferiaceae bacterium]|nr:lysoplasmalogenase [Schleiferiaceae bacterium]